MEIFYVLCVLALASTTSALQTYYMEEACGSAISLFTRNEDAILLRLSRNPTYRPNQDCVIAIEPPIGKELAITFRDLDIESAPNGQCTTDFLRLYDGRSGQAQFLQGLPQTICGSPLTSPILQQARMERSFETKMRYLTIQFQSRAPVVSRRGFEMLISAFRQGSCESNEARCNNQRCINNNLKCSGYDHCGDGTQLCLLTYEATVAIGVVAALVVIVIIIIIVVCVIKKKRKRDMNDEIQKDRYKKRQYKTVHPESIKVKTVSNGTFP